MLGLEQHSIDATIRQNVPASFPKKVRPISSRSFRVTHYLQVLISYADVTCVLFPLFLTPAL